MRGLSVRDYMLPLVMIIVTIGKVKCQDKTDSTETFQPRYYLYAGIFSPQINTSFTLNGDHTPGTVFSLENDAHLESHPLVLSVEGVAAITKRSTFALSYTGIDRSQEWNLDRDITIRD